MMEQAALILEGGALRGQYTAGVLDTFLAAEIEFKEVIGVSAGALCGANYISRQLGRTNQVNVDYRDNKEYISLLNFLRHDGIINFDFLFSDHGQGWTNFDHESYEKSPINFVIVATAMENGEPIYFQKPLGKSLYDDLKASASMPFVAQPALTSAGLCLDGGISDPIPFSYAANQGFKKIVVIKTRDRSYRVKPVMELQKAAIKQFYNGYPELMKKMKNNDRIYNHQLDWLDYLEKSGRFFVVAPKKPITIDRLESDKGKLKALYQLGRNDGRKLISPLMEYLAK